MTSLYCLTKTLDLPLETLTPVHTMTSSRLAIFGFFVVHPRLYPILTTSNTSTAVSDLNENRLYPTVLQRTVLFRQSW